MDDAILDRPLRAIAARLADGSQSARALTEAAIARRDPSLDAYVTWTPEAARRQAAAADASLAAGARHGGLQGVPASFKDLFGVKGLPTFAGSPRALPAAWAVEGPIVTRLRRQLGVIMGKTHTVEFAFGGLGPSRHHPVPWNPRDRSVHRAPGGSSSGAGVSVVEGTALVAFGTDTGGSVRIPASLTGCVGLKTTLGRWSTGGVVPLSPSFDTVGVLTRSADDAAYAFEALDGAPALEAGDSPLRLGVAPAFFWQDCDPGVAERIQAALRLVEASGARVIDGDLPGGEEVFAAYREGGIVSAELYAFLRGHLPDWLETLDPRVRRRVEEGRALAAWEYLRRKTRYAELAAAASAALDGLDAMIAPTVPITPPPVARLADPDTYSRLNLAVLRNTCVVSFLGLCAVTLPAGADACGMPVGLQIIGPPGSEPRLLAIAAHVERLLAQADIWRPAGWTG